MSPLLSKHGSRSTISIGIALAIVTFLIYLPARQHDFLDWDDQSYVVENDHVKGGLTWEGIIWAFTQSHSANWHPLTWLSHALDCQIYGLQAAGHHTTNILLHSFNATLLFLLLQMLTGSLRRSALVAGIFAMHPLRVESVAWVAERKDVLSTFLGLLTLMAYAAYAKARGEGRGARAGTIWYAAALGLFACGLMSKPMLVTWPFIMLLLDWWPLGRIAADGRWRMRDGKTWRALLWEKVPFFALAAVSCIITVAAQKHGGAVASVEHLPINYRLQNAATAYAEYLKMFFWPTRLSPIYPHPAQWECWQVIVSIVILLGISVMIWRGRARFPVGVTGWLWFLGTLVPVIGIIQVGSQAFADRYTYIPQIGLALLLVWLLATAAAKLRLPKFVGYSLAGIALAALAWRTTEQLTIWKNTQTLFHHTLERFPNNTPALNGLGNYYFKVGRIADSKRLLEKVLELEPTFVEARGTLADALESEGHYAEAVTQYEEALEQQPNNTSLLNNLAWLRAACPDPAIRNGTEAIKLATRACKLTSYSKPLFIGTLAAAQAETGEFQAAIATATRAVQLAEMLRLPEITARNRELIEFYRQARAAHGGLVNPRQ